MVGLVTEIRDRGEKCCLDISPEAKTDSEGRAGLYH